jgi:hypothetical protein
LLNTLETSVTASDLPAVPFTSAIFWLRPRRPTLTVPAQLRIKDDAVTATPIRGRLDDTIRLRPITDSLNNFADRAVSEHLLSVPGVQLDEWAVDDHWVKVPVTEPTVVTDDQVTWQVTSELALHHTDHAGGYLSLPATGGFDGPVRQVCVDLTVSECTELVVALASLQYWRFDLSTKLDASPAAKRRGLQRARCVRGITRR